MILLLIVNYFEDGSDFRVTLQMVVNYILVVVNCSELL